MRKRHVLGGSLLGLALVASLSTACGDPKGAIMLAINTDMKAPKDVNAVSVTISSNSRIIHSAIGRVTPQGEVLLPASLAIAEGDDVTASIRIRVMAFQERKARVLRDVRTNIPKGGRVAMLRIPLNFVNDESSKGDPLPPGVLPDPFPGTGGGSSGTSSSSGGVPSSAGEFDFLTQFQSTCSDPFTQTVIDGECKDSYVDPETLPDFDPGTLGNAEDPGSCFDIVKCLGGAAPIGQTSSGERPVDAGTGSGGGDAPPADAGAGKGMNVNPSALTFDASTCSLALNGASSSRLNLALETPDTGECVQSGKCYVPIDRGAGGWREENGIVKLPSFVCTLISKKNLRLVQTVDTCPAKEEKNPICATKKGDLPDGGPQSGVQLVVKADNASTVASAQAQLGWVDEKGLYFASLVEPTFTPRPVSGLPAASLPWRMQPNFTGPLLLTNGTTKAYTINGSGPSPQVTEISVPANTVHSAGGEGKFYWAVANEGPEGGVFFTNMGQTTSSKQNFIQNPPPNATSLLAVNPTTIIVGETSGAARGCQMFGGEAGCAPPQPLGNGRVEAIIPKPSGVNQGYALLTTALVSVTVDPATGAIQARATLPTKTTPVVNGASYFARTMIAGPQCVYFSSANGLEWARDLGGRLEGGVLVPKTKGEIVGVAIGPAPGGSDGPAAAIYFAQLGSQADGGGIYRVGEPSQCVTTSGADAGAGDGGGGLDSGTPQACLPNQCRRGPDCVFTNADNCGKNGDPCVSCVPGTCNNGMCVP